MITNPSTFSLFHFRLCVSDIKLLLDFPVRIAISKCVDSVPGSEQTSKTFYVCYQNGANSFILLFPAELQHLKFSTLFDFIAELLGSNFRSVGAAFAL